MATVVNIPYDTFVLVSFDVGYAFRYTSPAKVSINRLHLIQTKLMELF